MTEIVEDLAARRRRRNPAAAAGRETGDAAFEAILDMVGSCPDPVAAAREVVYGFAMFLAVWGGVTADQLFFELVPRMAAAVERYNDASPPGGPDAAA